MLLDEKTVNASPWLDAYHEGNLDIWISQVVFCLDRLAVANRGEP
jgi:hypothetical protein